MPTKKKTTTPKTAKVVESVTVTPLDMGVMPVHIEGASPYCQNRFSQKARNEMLEKIVGGDQVSKKRKRTGRDIEKDYLGCFHVMEDGSYGIPAAAFRNAAISACRMVGYKMVHAKLSIFIKADGFDVVDGVPLVKIHGKPDKCTMHVRLPNGSTDIRIRPMWRKWSAKPVFQWDKGQFSAQDIINLVYRIGQQVGVGEGRNDSKNSAGLGFGCFVIKK